jgi:hypothetical protein
MNRTPLVGWVLRATETMVTKFRENPIAIIELRFTTLPIDSYNFTCFIAVHLVVLTAPVQKHTIARVS